MSPQRVGSYDLLERIGEGGMGEVWLAQHESLRRLVAVKLIHPQTLSSRSAVEARKQFEREAHATSTLRSPHTVALFDYGATSDGNVYYAMELLDGISLAALVNEFGPVPAERAVHLLTGLCDSLAEAHDRGLVHRDVKPANVFTCVLGTKYDFVKVLDFGLARTLPTLAPGSSPAITGTIAGSPAFMAPEAARGAFAPSCDIYGVGCVAYWLLTGKFVFEAPTPIDVILAHMQSAPTPPSQHGVRVPPELEHVVLACLEKEPAKRPASAAELGALFEACPLETRWTAARARAFFDENRDAIARANPATLKSRAVAERGAGASAAPASTAERKDEVERASLRAPIDRLQHHFTRSHIDVNELELRMLRVKKAQTAQEVEKVFADLPALDPVTPASSRGAAESARSTNGTLPIERRASEVVAIVEPREASTLAVRAYRRPETQIVSIMSSNRRDIVLRDGEVGTAVAVMGEATVFVDCSQLSTDADAVAELKCVAVMGGLNVYVKAGVDVEATGVGVLGYFERWGGRRRARKGPLLRITGAAVLGGVKVVVAEEE
ncbi:MAG TPA: protein kinase [Polyangiaceae bacterium]|nr:protein kinase [Polyangiaceae bacterium]